MNYFNANSLHYFSQNSLHYLHYFELLSIRNFAINSKCTDFVLRLFAHSEDPDIDEPYQAPAGHTLGSSSETPEPMTGVEPTEPSPEESTAGGDNSEPQVAKSLKCDE